jgi:predicted PurR-regulated permease PerM
MRASLRQVWENPYVRILVYLLVLLFIYFLLRRIHEALTTLGIAFAFAYLTSPIVRWFAAHHLPRFLGVLVIYLGLILILGLLTFFVGTLVGQLSAFVQSLPTLLLPLFNWIQSLPIQIGHIHLNPAVQGILQQAGTNLQGLLQSVLQDLLGYFKGLLTQTGSIVGFFSSLVGGVFQLFTALTVSIYLLYDLPALGHALLMALPEPYQPITQELFAKLDRAVGGYVRGQLLVAVCMGLVVGIGLFVVGLPLATSLGFLAGLFSLIPFVGVILVSIPAVLLALSLGWVKVLLTLLVLWLANQLEGHLFGPLIVGRSTRLHPVTAIFAILAGVGLYGFWGALLAVPAAAFLKTLYTDYYRNSRFYREG